MLLQRISKSFKDKIAYKFFLTYFLAALVLLTFIIVYFYNRMYTSIITDYLDSKQIEISQISKGVDANIDSKNFQSTSLIYSLDLLRPYLSYQGEYPDYFFIEQEKQVKNLLSNLMITNYNHFDGVALFTMDGDLLISVSVNNDIIKKKNIQDEIWFENAVAADGSAILSASSQLLGKTVSNDIIVIARTVNDYNNGHKPLGISVFYQRISKFTKDVFTVSGRNIAEAAFFIATPEKSIIYADPYDENFMTRLIDQDILLLRSGEVFTFDNESYYIIYSVSPVYKFISAFLIPEYVISQKTEALKQMFLVITILLFIAGIIISYVVSHIISAPIKHTLFAASQVEQDNLDIYLNIRGNDEIAQIGKNILYLVDKIKTLMTNQYEQELYLKDIEFEALQSKINPHFLYNTLLMISLLINKEDFNTAKHMLLNLSDIFRYCLSRGSHTVPLSEEISHARKYLEIQQMRFNHKIQIYYDVDSRLMNCSLPRLTLQPILENSILHGLEPSEGSGEIRIYAQTVLDKLYIYIQDNGIGMSDDKLVQLNAQLADSPSRTHTNPSGKSIGLYNVNARIKLLFGLQYGIHLLPGTPSGIIVRISIPFSKTLEVTHENTNR